MSKSNIQYLRDIIRSFAELDEKKADEAEEFLDGVEAELSKLKTDIQEKDNNILELEAQKDEISENANSFEWHNVGLDEIGIALKNGNLAVSQAIQTFIANLKRKYGMTPDGGE